ncbi:uncharacterized protein LOC126659533 isoform X2 [Mercurialis annua]|uniref:uncharacterized protein LOC126659533 isoform X2 n=1 Tax=Mercurialis annua TaxID=3986 RepID=UPI00215E65DF|nr:uncharacterized protein LOC126659533 isoform X2 [Mercurialis annua]
MGLLFKVALECFNVLAWPLFALGYPLCASVQAIETNSITDTQKLVTYWICFSLISLFEHAFMNLLRWFTSWPYIKLVMVGCLIIPHFEGSLYVYKHLVHPCLCVNQQTVLDWLIKLKEFYLLIKEKGEAKETGLDAAKNPVSFGSLATFKPKLEEAEVTKKDSNSTAIVEKKELISTKQVGQIESGFALSGNRMCTPNGIKEIMAAKITGGDFLDILPSKKSSEDRTIDACQVTTTSEGDITCSSLEIKDLILDETISGSQNVEAHKKPQTLNCALCKVTASGIMGLVSHFQGKRHEDALQKLKIKIQTSKLNSVAAVGVESESAESINIPNKSNNYDIQLPWKCCICRATLTAETSLVSHLQGKRHKESCERIQAWKAEVSQFRCTICNVRCGSEGSLNDHLNGSKHLAKTVQLSSSAGSAGSSSVPN